MIGRNWIRERLLRRFHLELWGSGHSVRFGGFVESTWKKQFSLFFRLLVAGSRPMVCIAVDLFWGFPWAVVLDLFLVSLPYITAVCPAIVMVVHDEEE